MFLTVLVLLEGETAERSVDDEEDGDEEGGDTRRVHDGVRPRVVSRRRRRRCYVGWGICYAAESRLGRKLQCFSVVETTDIVPNHLV